ncbi:MAG: formate dehydrogenase subunit gamma [Telluria sp.]|nr:formate dehydrogenase subunit gamma [Telluria sp.]
MKTKFGGLILGFFLLLGWIGVAAAQAVPHADVNQASPAVPYVDSIDILKQNQAERSESQPGNLAPTYRIVNSGTPNYSSLPALEAAVLIQPKAQFPGQARATTAGEAWRQYRNGPLTNIGGWILTIVLLVIVALYLIKGQVKLEGTATGRLIERFTLVERLAHWTMAISFVLLALTGGIMLFGKYVLLPVFGLTLFGWLAFACKNIHNFLGPVFTVSIVVFFVLFVRDNLPAKGDLNWFVRFGGLFSGKHVSSGRFNAGEKIIFWGAVVLFGLIISTSGFVLDMLVPGLLYTRGTMQIANIVHIVATVLAASMILGHIYLGTLGMEGAYQSMRTGHVDDAWAQQHHDLWYDDIQSGKVARYRSPGQQTDTAKQANI